MDLIAVGISLIAAATFAHPPTSAHSNSAAPSQESRIEGIRANGVIYFDAPIHSAPDLLRR